jgi:tripartite-type tricarboxylate transporter receptor subunit TctC
MSTAPSLYAQLAYDPLVDFKTIGLVTEVPMTIIGSANFEPNTMEELIEHVTAEAENVNYGHAGIGAASHLCGLLIQSAAGAKVTEVPYDGTADVLDDLLDPQSETIDFTCDQTTNTTEHIEAGTVKPYAITTPERNDALPELETTTEAGFEDIQVTVWHGLYVPKDTPDDVVQALNGALKEALKDQNVIDTMAGLGTAPVAEDQVTPEAHTEKLETQIAFWKPVIEEAGVEPQ